MKILVFDDSWAHRQAAREQLGKDHEITLVGTYDEAVEALSLDTDYELFKKLKLEARIGDYPRDGTDEEKASYWKSEKELEERARKRPDFDVVLTDLLVPASGRTQGEVGREFIGREMPLGTIIALRAQAAGIKFVAIVTDMNHHNHPASAAFDGFPLFEVGGARVLCTNRVGHVYISKNSGEIVDVTFLKSPEGAAAFPPVEGGWYQWQGIAEGKDWKAVFDRLVHNIEK